MREEIRNTRDCEYATLPPRIESDSDREIECPFVTLEFGHGNVFCKEVSQIFVSQDAANRDVLLLDVVIDEAMYDGDMLELLWPGEDRFVHDGDGGCH